MATNVRHRRCLTVLWAICALVVTAIAVGVIVYSEMKNGTRTSGPGKLRPVTTRPNDNFKNGKRVLIIGAGMSGLAAANTLNKQGINFTILEAADRIGGRLKSVQFAGVTLPVGAHWVQGMAGNPILDLAKRANLSGKIADYEDYIFRSESGNDVTNEADIIYDNVFTAAAEKLKDDFKRFRTNKISDMSFSSRLRMIGWEADSALKHAIEYYEYDFEQGESPRMSSVRYKTDTTHEDFEDADFYIADPRGAEAIAQIYAGDFLTTGDSRLKYNQWVSDIEYDGMGCTVRTRTGEEHVADFCILTVSLGVLQNNAINFQPTLPEWKKRAIHKYSFTMYIVVYLKFPDNAPTFWDDREFILYADRRRGHSTFWMNHDVLQSRKTNILQLTVTEDQAVRFNKMDDGEIKTEVMVALRNMYGPGIPDPDDILVSRLGTDPLFYGCYSNRPYGMNGDDFKDFQAPLHRLFFSGEATSEKYFGYIHGGYFSGIDTANDVINCMKGACRRHKPQGATCFV